MSTCELGIIADMLIGWELCVNAARTTWTLCNGNKRRRLRSGYVRGLLAKGIVCHADDAVVLTEMGRALFR